MFLFYISVLVVAIIALGVSSGMVARSFLRLSRVVGMNEYIVSFVMLGIITSIPELSIAIAAIITSTPLLSVGNILGANFANITLALGLLAMLSSGIDMSRKVSKRVFWLSLLMALMPSFLVFGGGISRIDGLLLWALFVAYFILFARDANFLEESVPHIPYGVHYFSDVYPSVLKLLVGLLILILSSIFIVLFAGGLASYFSISLVVFGVIFLGLATTLPELFFGIRGAILQHPSLSLGNILASMVFNGTIIIGALSIASPTVLSASSNGLLYLNATFMIFAFILLSVFSFVSSRITRLEGVLLISLYLLFLVTVFIFVM